MKKLKYSGIIFLVLYALFYCPALIAQNNSANPIPLDPRIITGKLNNGLTYYIMQNKLPEKRAELWLTVNAGSSQEDDDQQGLAHFVEHMAFNGTRNFEKNELVNFLETSGVKFGPDLNAYTSFDETVYMLTLPTDSQEVFDKGFLVLEDWAHGLLFNTEEVRKERGVVGEEWRLGKGADERMRTKYFPLLFKNSHYANRLPIGKKEIIDTASVETLKRFYADWYRPDLMAVIAVGDFDVKQVEEKIKTHFSTIKVPASPRKLVSYPVPDHKETILAKVTDKEAPYSLIRFIYKSPNQVYTTEKDYKTILTEKLFNGMFSGRLQEYATSADPPFSFSFVDYGPLVRSKYAFTIFALIKDKNIERATNVIATETERVKQLGFNLSELERQKQALLAEAETAFNEKNKTESSWQVFDFKRHFLENYPLPGPEYRYNFYKEHINGITLGEVNSLAKKYITDGENLAVVITAPDKPDLKIPEDSVILDILKTSKSSGIKQYEDVVISKPLIEKEPKAGKIVSEKKHEVLELTEWTLSNGARVILKPTSYKNDEIIANAFSWGGSSLYDDKDYYSVSHASGIINESGVGEINEIQLNKYLTPKQIWNYSYVDDFTEVMGGQSTKKDIEILLQIFYLSFMNPGKDSTGYPAYINKTQSFIENQNGRPEKVFDDSVRFTMAQYHKRREPLNEKALSKVDYKTAFRSYRERFSAADDFTFLFVGSFNPDTLKPLVEKYIASLPSKGVKENWKDPGIRTLMTKTDKTIYKGSEPKSKVSLMFPGKYVWNEVNNITADALMELVRIKLREKLREEKGGTYGVSCYMNRQRVPVPEYTISVSFGCAPENVESLTNDALAEIKKIKSNGVTNEDLKKIKELLKRQHETEMQENWNWVSKLTTKYMYNEDPTSILNYNQLLAGISEEQLKQAAINYFNDDTYSKFVLMPADK